MFIMRFKYDSCIEKRFSFLFFVFLCVAHGAALGMDAEKPYKLVKCQDAIHGGTVIVPNNVANYWRSLDNTAAWNASDQSVLKTEDLGELVTFYKTDPTKMKDFFLQKKGDVFSHNAKTLAVLNYVLKKGSKLEPGLKLIGDAFQGALEHGYALQYGLGLGSSTEGLNLSKNPDRVLTQIKGNGRAWYATIFGAFYKISPADNGSLFIETLQKSLDYTEIINAEALHNQVTQDMSPKEYNKTLQETVEDAFSTYPFHALALGSNDVVAAGNRSGFAIFKGTEKIHWIAQKVNRIDCMVLTPGNRCLVMRDSEDKTKNTSLFWVSNPAESFTNSDGYAVRASKYSLDHEATKITPLRLSKDGTSVFFGEFCEKRKANQITTHSVSIADGNGSRIDGASTNFVSETYPKKINQWWRPVGTLLSALSDDNPNELFKDFLQRDEWSTENLSLESLLVAAHIIEDPFYAKMWPHFKPKGMVKGYLLNRMRDYGTLANGVTVKASCKGYIRLYNRNAKPLKLVQSVPPCDISDAVIHKAIESDSTVPITHDINTKFAALALVPDKKSNSFISTSTVGQTVEILERTIKKTQGKPIEIFPKILDKRTYDPTSFIVAYGKHYQETHWNYVANKEVIKKEMHDVLKEQCEWDAEGKKRVYAQTVVWKNLKIPIVKPLTMEGQIPVPIALQNKDQVELKFNYTRASMPWFSCNPATWWERIIPRTHTVVTDREDVNNVKDIRVVQGRLWSGLLNPFAWGRGLWALLTGK
jgi:hypothetical protein